MVSRFSLVIILGLAIGFWAATFYVLGIPMSVDQIKPFSAAIIGITAVFELFNRFVWRIAPLRWLVKRPDLRGTWNITLQSTYIDPKTKKVVEPVLGFASIKQTFTTLSVRLMTEESSSKLIAHNIIRDEDGTYEIVGAYRSEPKIELRGVISEIHYGSFIIRPDGSQISSMEGHYWTDRNTKGSINYSGRNMKSKDTFQSAKALMVAR